MATPKAPRLGAGGPPAAHGPTGAVRARVERLLRPSHGEPSQVPVRSQRAAHETPEDRRHTAQRGPGRRRVAGPGQRGTAELDVHGWRIDARGVDDPHIGRDRTPMSPARSIPDCRPPTWGSPTRPIGACSTPWPPTDAILDLAGHTHGGQVCLPWWGAPVTNCDLPLAAPGQGSVGLAGVRSARLGRAGGPARSPRSGWRAARRRRC